MNKRVIFTLLLVFLISRVVTAKADNDQQVLVIKLDSSDPGDTLKVSDIDWPTWISEQIDMVNDGHGEFFVEVYNDPTIWQLVNWLKSKSDTAVLNPDQMNLTLDGGLNLARMQNATRLLKAKGLGRLALRYLPDRGKVSMIKIYFVANNTSSDTLYVSRTDTIVAQSTIAYVIDSDWRIGIGSEATLIDNKFIVVPSVSIAMFQQNYKLSVTGGYWPGEISDKKFFATSLAYFPSGSKLGLMASFIYSSEAIDKGYIKQGYGPSIGLIWQSQNFDMHFNAVAQRFDDQYQKPSLEPTINLGVNFNAISF